MMSCMAIPMPTGLETVIRGDLLPVMCLFLVMVQLRCAASDRLRSRYLQMESEYMALSLATQEAIWLRRLVEELGYPDQEATVIYEDNQGAIATAHNPVFHRRTKHIQIRYHYVREAVAEEIIKAIY